MLQYLVQIFWRPQAAARADGPEDFAEFPEKRTTAVIFLVLRRMRVPLIVLLLIYAVAILGMIAVPGVEGKHMDIFHALYFISYTATTIGFGEIPEAFSDAQRLWVTVSIYLTVIAWLYGIGAVLGLLQDDALRRAIVEQRFSRTVRGVREPFYLICGYGDTGEALVSALEERLLRAVVIEIKQTRIDALIMENYPVYVPRLCADASKPVYLLEGGLKNPQCRGVVAITNDNLVNLHVGITAKLLNPGLKSICRVDSDEVAANMASFGTDRIINPYTLFAARLHTGLRTPGLYLLREWLAGKRDSLLSEPHNPPQGLWILCGYGRFGKAVYNRFKKEEGIRLIVVEAMPQRTGYPDSECVVGRGTEEKTLREACVEEAVGIVAGTDDDVNNLSIVMTARELNPRLFVVLRQNLTSNDPIFHAARADIVMKPSQIIADYIRVFLTTPLLADFLSLSKRHGNDWACQLLSRLTGLLSDTVPEVWEITLDPQQTPALWECLAQRQPVTLRHLRSDPRDRETRLACLPLLLARGNQKILLPEDGEILQAGDQVLWCGRRYTDWWMSWTLHDPFVLTYVAGGRVMPRGHVWRWLQARRGPFRTG